MYPRGGGGTAAAGEKTRRTRQPSNGTGGQRRVSRSLADARRHRTGENSAAHDNVDARCGRRAR